jgi:hypothetical protein
MHRYLLILVSGIAAFAIASHSWAHGNHEDEAMEHSVAQLRQTAGRWDVVTEFLGPDGSVSRSVTGSYEFHWVVPDHVLSGRSEIPELRQVAGLLFYIDPAEREIEMVSVGADGKLWIMSGPLGGEQRYSREFQTEEGKTARLRFTRFNVSDDAFESRMDYTEDGGETWNPGNHQVFRRAANPEVPENAGAR